MRSSSTDRARRTGAAQQADRPHGAASFLPVGRTAWLRLVVLVALALAALVAPRAIGSTGAVYTDRSTVSGDVSVTATITPTPSPA